MGAYFIIFLAIGPYLSLAPWIATKSMIVNIISTIFKAVVVFPDSLCTRANDGLKKISQILCQIKICNIREGVYTLTLYGVYL